MLSKFRSPSPHLGLPQSRVRPHQSSCALVVSQPLTTSFATAQHLEYSSSKLAYGHASSFRSLSFTSPSSANGPCTTEGGTGVMPLPYAFWATLSVALAYVTGSAAAAAAVPFGTFFAGPRPLPAPRPPAALRFDGATAAGAAAPGFFSPLVVCGLLLMVLADPVDSPSVVVASPSSSSPSISASSSYSSADS